MCVAYEPKGLILAFSSHHVDKSMFDDTIDPYSLVGPIDP